MSRSPREGPPRVRDGSGRTTEYVMTVCTQRNATARPAYFPLAAHLLDDGPLRLVRRDLGRLVGEPPRRGLSLDLSGVGVPTAAGLGGLVALNRRLRQAGH